MGVCYLLSLNSESPDEANPPIPFDILTLRFEMFRSVFLKTWSILKLSSPQYECSSVRDHKQIRGNPTLTPTNLARPRSIHMSRELHQHPVSHQRSHLSLM
jgi:hypothetical protein